MLKHIGTLVIAWLVYLNIRGWYKFANMCHLHQEPEEVVEDKVEQRTAQDKLQALLVLRAKKADALAQYLKNPDNKESYKALLVSELEVQQTLKGLKRQLLSELKYKKIQEAARTGTFDKDVLDLINAK